MNKTGKIIKIISNLYTVDTNEEIIDCRARGKFRNEQVTPLVGDFVVVNIKEKIIEEIKPRNNELSRPLISNVDAALVIVSVKEPELSLSLLDRQLVSIEHNHIMPIIILTKCDLLNQEELKNIKNIFKYYKKIGYKVINNTNIFKIKRAIKNKTVVLTGQTGAGKSTLLNKLDKKLNIKTSPISKALGRGVHTTRHVELYNIGGAKIADTPGFSALDLNIKKENLKNLYPEFRNSNCKFPDCEHDKEKDCEVKRWVDNGKIRASRYENYLKFRSEL